MLTRRALTVFMTILITVAVIGLPNGMVVIRDGSWVDGKVQGTVGYVDDGVVVEGKRGHEWEIETVDSSGDIGFEYIDMAIDTYNRPHILFYCNTNIGEKYAFHDGERWHSEVVNPNGDVCTIGSIALDTNNRPHVTYKDYSTTNLKYTHYDGNQWHTEIVDNSVSVGVTSIVLDNQNCPHISYIDDTNEDLKYAYFDGTTWHTETVDSNEDAAEYPSIGLDNNGRVHICYSSGVWPKYNLKYAYFNGNQWNIETVDPSHGWYPSIAIDSNNLPHIGYYDCINDVLRYAYHDGNLWITETALSGVYGGISIALDNKNRPHVSYHDNVNLKYAIKNDQNWESSTVFTEGEVARDTAIAVDMYGRPHIGFIDRNDYFLKYAVIPDNELPTLDADDSPSAGTTGDEFHFNVSASDNIDVASVSIEWNHDESGENLPLTMNGSYWAGIITLEQSIESLNYVVHITDVFDNEYTSESRTVPVLDNDLPTLLGDETPDTGTTGDDVMFRIRAYDNIAVDRVFIEWLHGETRWNISLDPSGGFFWTGMFGLDHGLDDLIYRIGIADAAGNTHYSTDKHVSITDNDAPRFIEDKSDSEAGTGGQFDFTASFEDNVGVVRVDVIYSFDGVNYESDTMESNGEEIWNLSIVMPTYPTNMSYYFIASDYEENEFNSFDEFGVYFVEVMDTIKPVAEAGDDGKIDQFQEFTFDGRGCRDNDGIDNYTWSLRYNGSVRKRYGMEVRHRFDIAGNYTVKLTVRDKTGNVGVDVVNVSVAEVMVGDDDYDDDVTPGNGGEGNGTVNEERSGILVWVVVTICVVAAVVVGMVIVILLIVRGKRGDDGGREKTPRI